MVFSLTWLPQVLLEAGLKVSEQPGWTTRGRGEMGKVKGVICHHTVGARSGNMPSLGSLTVGVRQKSGKLLPGPLAQLGLGRDGTYYVIAAGRCNHAGDGIWPKTANGITTGNSNFIGIEAENAGTADDPWPEVQVDAYVRGVAALLKHVGADAAMCCGHREYALPKGRKVDPHTIDMAEFRARAGAVMAGLGVVRPIIPAMDAHARRTVRRGDRGADVKVVQKAVGATQDGIFGPGTEAMLRAFQRQHGLVPDGIVGPKTWATF